MSGTTGAARARRHWPRVVVMEIVVLLLLPVVLGAVVGWYFINPGQNERLSPTGSEAHELLNAFPDNRLVVEVAYQSNGAPPPGSAISILSDRINETCSKGSVVWSIHPFSSGQTSFSDGDLLALATSERQVWPSPGTMALFYLYLTGGYAPDSSVLGLTFRGSSIAVFEGTIAQDAPGGSAAAVTATVLVHEFGHELGLVGIIGYAPNEDPAHPYHSNDPNDVMYWSVDSTAMLLGLLGGAAPSTQFDAADLSDLATVRSTWIPLEVLPWIVLAGILTAALILAVSYRRAGRRTKSAGEPSLPAAPTK